MISNSVINPIYLKLTQKYQSGTKMLNPAKISANQLDVLPWLNIGFG